MSSQDPKNNFAAQNVVPLINKSKVNDTITQTLNAVSAKLTTEELTNLNAEASSDAKPSPETVAKNWLSKNSLHLIAPAPPRLPGRPGRAGPEGGCNLLARFFRPKSMLRFLLVLALVAGLGTPARPVAAGGDPLALVGWWRVVASGETVVIDPSRFEVRTAARTAEGSWVGDSTGRFLARSYGVPAGAVAPGWLGTAVGFAVDGPNRVLLDRAGAPVARLVPTPAGTVTGAADPARPPSDVERRGAGLPRRSRRGSHRFPI